jgi:hypothetical protein
MGPENVHIFSLQELGNTIVQLTYNNSVLADIKSLNPFSKDHAKEIWSKQFMELNHTCFISEKN